MSTMSEQCYLGVDLGAESGRVVAGLFDGHSVRLEELHRFPNGPVNVGGTLRWNVLGLWQGIQQGLAAAAARFGDEVRSIGVDTWGVDYVLLSAQDELLGLPWHYRDGRTTGMLATACEQVPREEIFAATGLQFMELNTLYQLLAMKRDHPELLDEARRLLLIPDYFHWLLCGSRVVEFTNATTTQCFDPARNDWATELLGRLGLPGEIFPEVVPPGTSLGRLRSDVAAAAGLDRINVIAPATHDTGSAVAAVPTDRTGSASWTYISSGTWSLMGAEVNGAVTGPSTLAVNATNEGGIDGTFRLLKNIMGLWLVQECRRAFARDGRDVDYGTLTRQATDAPAFVSLVNPDDSSFLKPPCMPTAIRDFCRRTGQPEPASDGAMIRCALESLALKYRDVLEQIESLTGETSEVIHVVGGGSQNGLLNQFTADACGRPVIAGPVEATVLGNVLVQARADGALDSLGDIREVVANSTQPDTFTPNNPSAWDKARERFAGLTD
ncbi:MAG: rhamnulokinase family protein [Planctomycetota bacterium]|nr:rhamnulokinase family protein [Planctomycetota bacterium]